MFTPMISIRVFNSDGKQRENDEGDGRQMNKSPAWRGWARAAVNGNEAATLHRQCGQLSRY